MTALDNDQLARVEALKAAREVLAKKLPGTPFSAQGSEVPEVTDLVNIARFVIDGNDPWSDEPVMRPRVQALVGAFDELFTVDGSAKVSEWVGINLPVKAELLQRSEPELSTWLLKVHKALNGKTIDGYPDADVAGVPWDEPAVKDVKVAPAFAQEPSLHDTSRRTKLVDDSGEECSTVGGVMCTKGIADPNHIHYRIPADHYAVTDRHGRVERDEASGEPITRPISELQVEDGEERSGD